MPSFYTATIGEGATFKDFFLRCSRAFIHDEGDPIAARRRDVKYHEERMLASANRLLEFLSSSQAERQGQFQQHVESTRKVNEEIRATRENAKIKYEAMLAQVNAWKPPIPEMDSLKEFMQNQISQSIEHDCAEHSADTAFTFEEWSDWFEEWSDWQISSAQRDFEYHKKELKRTEDLLQKAIRYIEALEKVVSAL